MKSTEHYHPRHSPNLTHCIISLSLFSLVSKAKEWAQLGSPKVQVPREQDSKGRPMQGFSTRMEEEGAVVARAQEGEEEKGSRHIPNTICRDAFVFLYAYLNLYVSIWSVISRETYRLYGDFSLHCFPSHFPLTTLHPTSI